MTDTLRFRIAFSGPFHVARGEAAEGADRTVDRDVPLPASSLKGVMRAAAGQRLGLPSWLVDQVFGSTGAPSPWAWSDAAVAAPVTAASARIRMTDNGVVAVGALLIGEQVWSNQADFTVTQNGDLCPEDIRVHRTVLRAAARDISALGGARRRGDGWVHIDDEAPWTVEDSTLLIGLRKASAGPDPSLPGLPAPLAVGQAPRAAEWRVLRYRIVTEQRVSAGIRAEVGNDQPAHQVIPGSAVRGALATAWMRGHGLSRPDQRMADLFERDVIVRQAVPVGGSLIPISGRSCKYEDPADHGSHQRHDEAADRRRELIGNASGRTPEYCLGGSTTGKGWQVNNNQQVRATRTALAENGTAKDGQLFSVRATRPQTILVGEILVSADDPDFLAWLTASRSLRIGGQRSIAGAATWEARDVGSLKATDPDAAGSGSPSVLRCRSPLIAVDKFGASTPDIGPTLARAFPSSSITVVQSWVRTTPVGGWHMASDLPKPEELAIAPGSTFLVSGLPENARAILRTGLGLRRLEGFGEVEVVDANDDPWNSPVMDPGIGPETTAEIAPTGAVPETHLSDLPGRPAPSAPVDVPTHDVEMNERDERADPIGNLLAAVPPERRAAVLAGLRAVTADIASYQSSGRPDVARGVAQSATRRPWARDLPAAATDLITQLLSGEQIDVLRDRLRSYTPGKES